MARAQIETSFPPGIQSVYASSEHIGAFHEMNLDRESLPTYHPHPGTSSLHSPAQSAPSRGRSGTGPYPEEGYPPPGVRAPLQGSHNRAASFDAQYQAPPPQQHIEDDYNSRAGPAPVTRPYSQPPLMRPTSLQYNGSAPRTPTVRYNLPEERVYMPTTVAPSIGPASTTTEGRRKYDKLADVYSMSGDTVEFTRNFGGYVSDRCPMAVWAGSVCVLMFMGLMFMLYGAFNLPFCTIQPMIPIYLLVAGLLIMASCSLRLFGLIPTPPPAGGRRRQLSGALCLYLFEAILGLINVVWLILGAVWVYGNKPYVHFHQGMFDEHYCDGGLYWISFAAVTAQLLLIALGIVVLLILMCAGAYKEADIDEGPLS